MKMKLLPLLRKLKLSLAVGHCHYVVRVTTLDVLKCYWYLLTASLLGRNDTAEESRQRYEYHFFKLLTTSDYGKNVK